MTWLLAGLGNPGPKYASTRHNIGFMVADEVVRRGVGSWREKFKGQLARVQAGGQDVFVLKPMTFMNLSGVSVGAACHFYRIPPERVIVVHDELDIEPGLVRLKQGGGHAGHNGLRSIFEHFGRDFLRCRCGIGRSAGSKTSNYVLSDFNAHERALLPDFVDRAADAIELVLKDGLRLATNVVHAPAS